MRATKLTNPNKRNGPLPTAFKTCVICNKNKSRRQHFGVSGHYFDHYDDTCLACRGRVQTSGLYKRKTAAQKLKLKLTSKPNTPERIENFWQPLYGNQHISPTAETTVTSSGRKK